MNLIAFANRFLIIPGTGFKYGFIIENDIFRSVMRMANVNDGCNQVVNSCRKSRHERRQKELDTSMAMKVSANQNDDCTTERGVTHSVILVLSFKETVQFSKGLILQFSWSL